MLKKIIEDAKRKLNILADDMLIRRPVMYNLILPIVEQAYKAGQEDALKEYLPGKENPICICKETECICNGWNDCIDEIIDRAKKDGINLESNQKEHGK